MSFLEHIRDIEDPRIPGVVLYRLDEILLTVLVGLLCRGEDFDEIEDICGELLGYLRRFLPFAHGIAPAQTLRRTLARSAGIGGGIRPMDRQSGQAHSRCRGDRWEDRAGFQTRRRRQGRASSRVGLGAGAGLILAQQAVDGKSNEITAIPELLDRIELEGAIVTIDAMGTQKAITAKIITRKADYVLALKGNQGTLEADAALFFADPVLAADCPCHDETDSGHGRIEERTVRAANAAWLAERHPEWKGLTSIVSVTVRRTIKKTGATSTETRLFISSLPPDPRQIAAAVRAHWSIENNLHWALDVTFREDECRVRKDHSARNLAMIRRVVLNLLRREPSRISLKRKRLKAAFNHAFRTELLAR